MKYRVGACALLIGLAGCSADNPAAKFAASTTTTPAEGQRAAAMPVSGQSSRSVQNSIANAPDLGALVSYKNKGAPAKQEGAYTWYPVAISEAHALQALMSGEMIVPAPDGTQVKLRYERHEEQADGNWTWVGRIEGGDQKQEAILTFGQDAVFGSIPQPNGAPPLSLQTRAGSLFAVVTDRSKVVSPNTRATDAMVPPALALRASLAPAVQQAVAQGAVAVGAPATSANTIDLAIGFTSGFAAVYGGESAATTRLTYLIYIGNQAYLNSQINGYLRLVKAVKVDYADNTDNEVALGQLTGHNGTSTVTVPAALTPIRTARDEFGADLAVLVRKFQTPENNGCGIAWLNGAGQTAINPAVDDDFGYAVVSDGSDLGTDGKTYFCAEETLVHELGHLMGSAHDRDNSKDGSGNLQYGRYPYSFGMKTNASNGNFYTIMAYGDNLQNFYRTFSNPLVLKCGPANNLACGVTDQTDNARSLNSTIPVVAQFRNTIVPFTAGLLTDANADGRSDIFWRNTTGTGLEYWLMQGSTWTYGATQSAPSKYKVGGIGDFNGDGRADILWYDDARTELHVWLANGAGGYVSTFLRGYPQGWDIAGIGDANGDGRADVFWHNPTSGQIEYWLMNGATWTYGGARTIASKYRVGAIGDFNGDGYADVIWYDQAKTELWIWTGSATGAFTSTAIRAYPQGWDIVGHGDVNADGRSDLFWHNPAASGIEYWLMNGEKFTYGGTRAINGKYRVAQVGDFSGDGYADVIWYDEAKTELWIWQGVNGTFTSTRLAFPGGYPAGWQIVH